MKLSLARRGSFANNVLTLLLASSFAQLISILVLPILTRIYTPLDYAVFALYTSLASVMSVVAAWRYELTIMLPLEDEDASNVGALSIITTFTTSLITVLVVAIFGQRITMLLDNASISNWLFFIPITVFCTGTYQTLYYWSNRKKHYPRLALSRISLSASGALIKVGMGVMKMGASGLILGGISGQGIATAVLGWQTWKGDKKYKSCIRKKRIGHYFKKYKDYLIFNSPSALLNSISKSLPVFILSSFFDPFVLGSYSLSVSVIVLPLTLMSSSLEQVFYQRVTEKHLRGEPLKPQVLKTAFMLAAIYFLPAFVVYAFGTELFSFVFGEQWKSAGRFSEILVIPFALRSVISPLTMTILAVNKVRLGSLWHLLYFVTLSSTLLFATRFSIESFLIIYGLHEIALYGIYFYLTLRVSSNEEKS